jgi:hypothetical protein
MAGTALNWRTARIVLGPGRFYANLGGSNDAPWDIPSGSRLLLHTDGSPESNQNPNAIHIGITEGGEEWRVGTTRTDFRSDELIDPVASRITEQEVIISGSYQAIGDMDVAEIMLPTATRSDIGGAQGITFGSSNPTILYRSFAVIWPVEGSTTEFHVFHVYKGYNDTGLAAQVSRTKMGASPFAIRGYPITTRTDGDYTCYFFRQVSGGS